MTSPPPTEPYLRIAHSIQEQIMISGFTEHEIKILLFILRLSWGCGRRSAYVPRQKDFELIGVGENHVKTKLDYLIRSRVIFRDGCRYEFNKNYAEWQISRVRTYSPESLSRLIGLNLRSDDEDRRMESAEEEGLPQKGNSSLLKGEDERSPKGKAEEAEPASPKENINKNKNNYSYISIANGEEVEGFRTSAPEAIRIWVQVLGQMRAQVSAANYRTWLEKTQGLGYRGRNFFVGAAHPLVAEHLVSHLRSLLEKTLIQVSRRPFTITFLALPDNTS